PSPLLTVLWPSTVATHLNSTFSSASILKSADSPTRKMAFARVQVTVSGGVPFGWAIAVCNGASKIVRKDRTAKTKRDGFMGLLRFAEMFRLDGVEANMSTMACQIAIASRVNFANVSFTCW